MHPVVRLRTLCTQTATTKMTAAARRWGGLHWKQQWRRLLVDFILRTSGLINKVLKLKHFLVGYSFRLANFWRYFRGIAAFVSLQYSHAIRWRWHIAQLGPLKWIITWSELGRNKDVKRLPNSPVSKNNYSKSVFRIWASQRFANAQKLAIIISYQTSASGMIVFFRKRPNNRKLK